LKRVWRARLEALRNRLALTPKEKRIIAFVIVAFLLGLGVKCYRETHPQTPSQMDKKHPWRKYQTPSRSRARSPAKTTRESRPFISSVGVAKREKRSVTFCGSPPITQRVLTEHARASQTQSPIPKTSVWAGFMLQTVVDDSFDPSMFAQQPRFLDRDDVRKQIDAFTDQICKVIVGKTEAVKLAVACLLARGHLLIEDIPGVGKTTLSQALARSLALGFQRIQFTSDLLPADILGNSIFDREEQCFVFHRGPLFSQVVLIDEVNRATAKTQSALLEAMEEHHISVDGVTYELPQPFFVVATQNPQHQVGTFPLPESQLDRFLMRIELGVPDRASERTMLLGMDRREMLKELKPVFMPQILLEIQEIVREVHTSAALLDYLQDLLDASRQRHSTGLSPRAGLALKHASQAWAFMSGRDMVLPEDIQAVARAVMAHRLGHDI
jgi:MoxR-like ATPase